MPENRFYIDQDFSQNALITLPKKELKHLCVMRKSPGDEIEIVNGRNTLAKAILATPDTAQITSLIHKGLPMRQIILAQALLRPKNLDIVIEKGTELGASAFWLFAGDKSEKKSLSDNQLDRLFHLAISALKQCGRLDLPQILLKPPLFKWDILEHPLVYGSVSSTIPLDAPETLIIAIGPESGFSPLEITHLNRLEAKPISLGPNILRAETAAICALSQASK